MTNTKEPFPNCKTRKATCGKCLKKYQISSHRTKEGEIIECEWRECQCKDSWEDEDDKR